MECIRVVHVLVDIAQKLNRHIIYNTYTESVFIELLKDIMRFIQKEQI